MVFGSLHDLGRRGLARVSQLQARAGRSRRCLPTDRRRLGLLVIVIVAAMQWGNWPWSALANKHLRALTAAITTLGGGYLLLLAFKVLLHGIVPVAITSGGGFPYMLEAAELGVCLSLCSLIVGLVFPPSQTGSVVISRILRTGIVTVAAIATYVIFIHFFATNVLYFPAITGSYGGNFLLRVGWTILLLLWHSVAFGGHLATRRGNRHPS